MPGAFSAGNDLADFMAVAIGGEVGGEVWDFLLALANAGKPLVSGVDGIAVGIGATLNLHCDLTYATPRTAFHTPFVDLGLVPEGVSLSCRGSSDTSAPSRCRAGRASCRLKAPWRPA